MNEGTIVDATIIAAPPSMKNPDTHQTKKGRMWHFGMNVRVGVDADSGLVHSLLGMHAQQASISAD